MKKGVIVLLVVIGSFLASVFWAYAYYNSLRTMSISHETTLNAQYLSNQNQLSAYVSGFYEQLGIVKYKSEKLDEILTDYAKGRSFGQGKEDGQAAFINAVVEAVPDLKGLDIADKMMNYVSVGRESYKVSQDKLLDMLRSYDFWRSDGAVQSVIVEKLIGVPTQRLEARIGTTVVRGMEARDKMYLIVLAPQAKKAYESGEMAPLEVAPQVR